MDSGHTRGDDANAPSYDSSDEWEIGLGNLIIDLDADLEKDGHHHDGAVPNPDANSPMKVGKMKIKRKVSSSATKGEAASLIGTRKDSNASTGPSTPEDPSSAYTSSPDMSGRMEEKSGKPTKSVSVAGAVAIVNQSGGNSGSSARREGTPSQKQDKVAAVAAVPTVAIKPVAATASAVAAAGGSVQEQMKAAGVNILNATPAATTSQLTPALAKHTASAQTTVEVKQQKTAKCPEDAELAEEGPAKKAKMDKDGKVDVAGKRCGEASSSSGRKHGGKKAKVDKPLRQSVGVDTMDIGIATEPENIGPCEPGTSVNLEGIVWHETDQGVLVVNVTWRNKTYVGTLMDCTRHDWAAPRFCDSPTSDLERSSGRPKRGRNTGSGSSDLSNYTETRSSIHSKLRNSAKGRRGSNASNGTRTPPCTVGKNTGKRKTKEVDVEDSPQSSKRQKTGSRASSSASEGRNTPLLIECPEPNCSKKYKHKNGLHYHLSHAHHNSLDKDGNWKERQDDQGDDDSKSNTSDDVSVSSIQTKDKKRDVKDKKDACKEDERMDVDRPSTTGAKSGETSEDDGASRTSQAASPVSSVDSGGDSSASSAASQKKGESAKTREVTKSPKALKNQVDKFTAGMKCLGIPKPKEGKSSPAKAPKNDAAADKAGKSAKKQLATSSDKDMSIFDFNSTGELDEQRREESHLVSTNDRHVNVSVIRPNPETTPMKSEPVSPTSFAKVLDHAKGPKQQSSTNEQGPDEKGSKKTDKDKSKSEKHKKPKHDKVVVKAGKSIRPIAPAPPAPAPAPTPTPLQQSAPAPPPQLIAIPTTLVQNSTSVTCAISVPSISTVATKTQVLAVNPSLKPIQPKPIPSIMAPSQDAGGSPSIVKDKDKKLKPKKKMKGEKEKERDKVPGSPADNAKQSKEPTLEQRQKNLLLPAVPETNILKQALTASGIVEPEGGDKSKALGNKGDAPPDRGTKVPTSMQEKSASTPPVTSIAIPQIPKLIPTSSVTVPSSRPSKQLMLPMQQQPQHSVQQAQQTPSQLQTLHQHQQQPLPLTTGVKLPVGKPDIASQERASSNLSVHPSMGKEGPKNSRLLSPPNAHRTGNISPAYSDISEDGADEQSKPPKTAEAFSFEGAGLIKPQTDAVRRGPDGNPGMDQQQRMPMFHPSDRKGITGGVAIGSVCQAKPPQERDDGKKSDNKDQGSQKPTSVNQSLPPSVPHLYSGSHYPYLPGYVNMDPNYLHLMANDPQYRQQQEKLAEEQRKRAEKLRTQEGSEKVSENKLDSSAADKRRPMVNLQTEPITPPQAPRHPDRSREKDQITKSRHLDFQKKEGGLPSVARVPESDKSNSAMVLAERQRDEMRQYYLYQQKLMEEQRKNNEQESRKKDGVELPKKDSVSEPVSKSRTPTPTARSVSTPTKESPSRLSADAEKMDSKSPSLAKTPKLDGKGGDPRKLVDGFSYLQSPYPYGSIPFDPAHPGGNPYQAMVYPAFLHPELRFPPTTSAPVWKPPTGDKPGFEPEPDRGSSSPHSNSLSLAKSRKSPDSAHESTPPARPLDVLQQRTNQYFSPPPPQKHGASNPSSRPRTPEKGSGTPGPRPRSQSPAARKTPEGSVSISSSSSSGKEERRSQPTVHQHMHTHQHTHVGMGFPVLPSYHDPYVLASQQAAAAAAASASAAAVPFSVRREKS